MPGARVRRTLDPFCTKACDFALHDDDMPARRLPSYDYASAGAYFVTICTHCRAPLFASRLAAQTVQACWAEIPAHFPVDLDAFVVMPNHVHAILVLPRAGHARPLQTIVGSFKSTVARAINRQRGTVGKPVWQRGYYERVVRDERELEVLREYIVNNPASWDADPENPCRTAGPASAPWL